MSRVTNDPADDLRRWQVRIFSSVWITYFAYYLCRYNMPMAKTQLCDTFLWDEAQFGMILTSLLLMYAVGQFVNGQLADRFGTRIIASLGVLGSVVMNLLVFAVVVMAPNRQVSPETVFRFLVIFWGINGFFQAMGWTPMVRVMAHWFPTSRRGKVMGLMGTCYQFGAAFSWFLAYFIIEYYSKESGGDWRVVFLVPAVLFAVIGVFFFLLIRNSPEDVGQPAVEAQDGSEKGGRTELRRTISHNIVKTLKNPYVWVVALTFFLLDLNRYGFVNWLPAFLDESEVSMDVAGFGFKTVIKRCIHPLSGSAGAVVAGWATDRFFKGRRAPVIAFLLLMLGIFSIIFPYIDPTNTCLVTLVIALIGFCTYGPHILMVGHAAQDFGKKAGAAGAAGFIDGMGYIGAALAGWGAGVIVVKYGYKADFITFGLAAILGALLVCLIWKAGPKTHTSD